ncbi:hypothetical protein [Sandaracinus amylolyticus]|uniref:Lipoprotein n=1 Tax=Sandaracinus amylolyticus TaxID=927083 RepID=A0A0F6W819_9BACT|nr:hypothetical protein [Sandaracinus amylolyticus]AKF09696.1 hypothetical protein DB32_006845 [Sandaracinus amylolyticus]
MRKTVLVACFVLIAACREEDPVSDAGVVPDASIGGSLDCAGLLGCAAECADEPCADGCVARATPDAITRVSALIDCVEREGCGEDDACIEARCGSEVASCLGGEQPDGGVIVAPHDGGGDALPSRIEGTTRDFTESSGLTLDSNATVVFVRDDAAGEAAGFPIASVAFYRVERIEYRATATGTPGGVCSLSADETESFVAPDPFENNLMIERTPGADGLYHYELSTSLSVHHPNGMVTVCPPPAGTSTGIFNAEHNVSSGTSMPRGDARTFVGSTTLSARMWSWDLRATE